jgi:ATP adenylyltransferase
MRQQPDLHRLWAPWRSQFLSQRKRSSCFLCAAKRLKSDRALHVVSRGREVFVILNLYPYNNGHLMIVPYRHIGTLERLRQEEWLEMLRMSQQLMKRLTSRLKSQGFNIGLNLGRVAGAGVPGHLHLHLVPRWEGDTNFMPVASDTKVISQSLDEVYQVLTKPPIVAP